MIDITITPLDNGPALVKGTISIVDVKGQEIAVTGASVALCRCGGSAHKPFCDGTHVKIGFKSVVRARQSLVA